ncbi:hypothetical protein GCM10010517_30240 [Streptosporangium fragile]|uniref:Uncharacterized protein n=1 Tax=Streptosporangium fragile TaxID=46186 RepID=A0ABP6ICN3_9ACTN
MNPAVTADVTGTAGVRRDGLSCARGSALRGPDAVRHGGPSRVRGFASRARTPSERVVSPAGDRKSAPRGIGGGFPGSSVKGDRETPRTGGAAGLSPRIPMDRGRVSRGRGHVPSVAGSLVAAAVMTVPLPPGER